MAARSGPTVLRRYIALELRRLREASGLQRKDVAERLRCATSHVTHLEVMRNLPRPAELELLLGLYGADDRAEAFLELLDSARRDRDWWEPFKGASPEWFDLYLGMEAAAAQIQSYDAMVIPGLFQTPAYAEAIIRAGEPELDDAAVHHRVELRMARQDVLTRQHPPIVWCVLDESVLHRPAGPGVLAEQLAHLLKLTEMPHINLQVLPLDAGLHTAVSGTFTVLTFTCELAGHPGVAYAESRIRGTYYEDTAEIVRYQNTLTRLQIAARTMEDTRVILTRRIEEIS